MRKDFAQVVRRLFHERIFWFRKSFEPSRSGQGSTSGRRYSASASAGMLALLFCMGSAPARAAAVKNPDTFVYAITGDVDSLDPHWQYDNISQGVMWQIYETLIFYKGSSVSEFEPLLATIVPSRDNGLVSPDGLTYTFPIRKGVRFHDGSPMTPEDAKYSLLRFLLMDRAGGGSELLLEPILGVPSTRDENGKPIPELFGAADDAIQVQGGALVIKLKKPFAPFLSILASFCPIVSKPWAAAHGDWNGAENTWIKYNNPAKQSTYLYDHVNGTGPFKLGLWNQREKQLILARNRNYWRAPTKIKILIFKTVDEFATRKLMIEAGDADAIMAERQFLPQMAGLDGVAIEDDLPFLEVHNVFVFNFKVNPVANPYIGSGRLDGDGIPPDFFEDPDIRKAFAHAFDYDAYIRDGYRGKGDRARGPIPKGVPGYNSRQAVVPYSLNKAGEYFRKAFGGKLWAQGFRLTVSYQQGRADRQLACEILKRGVESINPKFRVDIHAIQYSTFLANMVAHKLPLVNARWDLDYPDPHNCAHPFLHSQGYYAKNSGYNNPRADQLIDAAAQEMDPDKRRAMYRDIQEIAYQDLPAIFTIDTYFMRVRRAWVHAWDYNPILMNGYFYPVYKGNPS